jgi:hypothetical protein
VTIVADAATRLQIAQNGITFTLSSHGGDAKLLGLAGYVDLNPRKLAGCGSASPANMRRPAPPWTMTC